MTKTSFEIREVQTKAYSDQQAGTAGLRKKVSVFQQENYLQNFVQSIFDSLKLPAGATLVVGGDGRYYNREAVQIIVAMAAANGIARLIVGQDGLLSTPAASHLIRDRGAAAGILLTASHNPGGPNADFGIKFNMANGGQAPAHMTDAVFERSKEITAYRVADLGAIDLNKIGVVEFDSFQIEIVDPVADYATLMQELFDFKKIRAMLASGVTMRFDAMNAVTGPYGKHIFCGLLGAPDSSVQNAIPLEDFGGLHPDPNPVDAAHLMALAESPESPDLLAASDGDGDRNMILGQNILVSPGDSLAIILANIKTAPGYRNGVSGVARSMPTARAVDAVAEKMGVPCFETPTGWRYFSNLLEAGLIGLCGEESFGTSSAHTGEKDGIWAVLFWLNMMASLNKSVAEIVHDHWREYGRVFFQRRDYFIEDTDRANKLMQALTNSCSELAGSVHAGLAIQSADIFNYTDPIDQSVANNQGIRVYLNDGARIVYRLSGTGTSGATLRVYLDKLETEAARISLTTPEALGEPGNAASAIALIEAHTGLTAPTAIV